MTGTHRPFTVVWAHSNVISMVTRCDKIITVPLKKVSNCITIQNRFELDSVQYNTIRTLAAYPRLIIRVMQSDSMLRECTAK